MTKKPIGQWGDEIGVTLRPQSHASMWECPLCGQTYQLAARDTAAAAMTLARLAFMDHMEAAHKELVEGTLMTASGARSARQMA